jgi:hypothetical protein
MTPTRPEAIIRALHRPAKYDGCIPTFTGRSFNLLDPKSNEVVLDDIAQGLAYKFRYGGQIGPITIAEHSVLVSRVIEVMWPKSKARLPGLLHDACEAYTHDIQAPVRKFLKVSMPSGDQISWGDLERKINHAVSKALWDGTDFYAYPEVQAADILAVVIEKASLPTIQYENWGLPPIPPGLEQLIVGFMPPEDALELFKTRYAELT